MANQVEERKKELMANADRIAAEILALSRNSLFVTLRFLDVALCQFLFISDPEVKTICTTGKHIIYNTNYVIQEYMSDKQSLVRDYLHMVLHCIFRHPFVSRNLNRDHWDLATDVAVEGIISDLQVKQTRCKNEEEIEAALDRVRQKMKTITAEKVYQMLENGEFSIIEMKEMRKLFYRDDHAIWWKLAEQAEEQARKEREKREAGNAGDEDYRTEEDNDEDRPEKDTDNPEKDPNSQEQDSQDAEQQEGDDSPADGEVDEDESESTEDGEDGEEASGEESEDNEEDEPGDSDDQQPPKDQQEDEEEDDDDEGVMWSDVEDPDGTPGDDPDGEPDPDASTHQTDEPGEGKGDGQSSGEPGETPREDTGEGDPQSGEAEGQGGEGEKGGDGQEKGGSSNQASKPQSDEEQMKQSLGQKKSSSGQGQQQSTSRQAGEASSGMGGGQGTQDACQHQSEGLSQDGEQGKDGGNAAPRKKQIAEAVQGGKGKPDGGGEEDSAPQDDPTGASAIDDKELQYPENEQELKELEQRWKEISERLLVDLETSSKEWGDQSNALLQEIKNINRDKYDYSVFLRKFATYGEDIQINPDEFDYVYYTYGLQRYGNMPLIEPLEYKEVKKIHDFVIAIDTSGSCSGELVQKFLDKTYSILTQAENFFKKVNIHIIQCDAEIQNDVKITSKEEFDTYVKNMQFYGFGGTDFRPVFEYVNKLIDANEFSNLKGLIYFTDGNGTYPTKRPKYETAFVFIDDDTFDYEVPSWAMKLVLETQDILEEVKIN